MVNAAQVVPFHRSASEELPSREPTALHDVADLHATESKAAPPRSVGVDRAVQALPFHSTAKALGPPDPLTAVQESMDGQETAVRGVALTGDGKV